MGKGIKKSPPRHTTFSSVTSKNVRVSPHFLFFSFNPFVTLLQNFKATPSVSPKLLNLNQDHTTPLKKWLFSNPYKIEVMITFLTEMLELPNLGHMATSTIWFE